MEVTYLSALIIGEKLLFISLNLEYPPNANLKKARATVSIFCSCSMQKLALLIALLKAKNVLLVQAIFNAGSLVDGAVILLCGWLQTKFSIDGVVDTTKRASIFLFKSSCAKTLHTQGFRR